jgi:hypothetical protein
MKQISHTACIQSTPFFSIIISTIVTIATITITSITITITITTIGYFTLQLFLHDIYVTPPYQRSPIHGYQLAPNEASSTTNSLLPAKALSPRPAMLYPPLPAGTQ